MLGQPKVGRKWDAQRILCKFMQVSTNTNQVTSELCYRHRVSKIIAIGCVVAAFVGCNAASNKPLARVGERTITARELQQRLVRTDGAPLLLQMIDTKLIVRAAQQQGVDVSDAEIAAKVEGGVAQMASRHDLLRRLEAMGQTLDDYKAAARGELLLDKLARTLIDTSEEQLRTYYEQHREQFKHGPQVHGRWMLFQDQASAQAVREVIEEPDADFAGLARAVSSDSVTAEKGGDMGFFEAKDYAPAVGKVAFALQPDQISEVFEVPDGWAFLQVIEKRPAGVQPFSEIREMLRARIQAETIDQARQLWLNQARENARLHIPDKRLRGRVEQLIAGNAPYQPTRLLDIPAGPSLPN